MNTEHASNAVYNLLNENLAKLISKKQRLQARLEDLDVAIQATNHILDTLGQRDQLPLQLPQTDPQEPEAPKKGSKR